MREVLLIYVGYAAINITGGIWARHKGKITAGEFIVCLLMMLVVGATIYPPVMSMIYYR